MKKNVKLIPYSESLAEGIAEMWNNSIKGWNGGNQGSTTELIASEESCSSHLHFVLAETDGLIAGYCKTYVDHQDTGALYVGLLNVRDDYHGKKIGKMLVLDAVNKTIELGWPRIDLHTWAGNLKAVPLYKKCGFFWEKRDDTTHLINLIPTVLQTELFSEYFKKADWYNDSTRPIEIKPDEHLRNKFDCWTYGWDKDGDKLEVEFTRRGRGIRRIETNDYLIETEVENLELVYGNSYSVRYTIKSKSGRALAVELEGASDRNIDFAFSKKLSVTGEEIIDAQCKVNPVKQDQPEWKTHPCVITDIKVNGKKVCFKTGIIPKAPLDIQIRNSEEIPVLSASRDLYFDLESHLGDGAEFTIILKDTDCVHFLSNTIQIMLEGKHKRSVKVPVRLSANSAFAQDVEIEVKISGKQHFSFTREIIAELHTGYGSYQGEDGKAIRMGIGNYGMSLRKEETNCIGFGTISKRDHGFWLLPPKPGKPFHNEFEQKMYSDYRITEGKGWIQMALDYDSDKLPKLHFTKNVRLYENGIHERWFDVENRGKHLKKDLAISESHHLYKDRLVLPYSGKYIHVDADTGADLHIWNSNKFSETWLYSETANGSLGFSWTSEHELHFAEEALVLVSVIGNLEAGEKKSTRPLQVIAGEAGSWQLFRDFVCGKQKIQPCLTPAVQLEINNGNPFVKTSYQANLISWCETEYEGELNFKPDRLLAGSEQKKWNKEYKLTFQAKAGKPLAVAELEMKRSDFRKTMSRVICKISDQDIVQNKKDDIFTVNNSCLSMKAAKSFSPSLYSLEYEGKELLDSNFPELGARSWWNPWPGGIMGKPHNISIQSILEEEQEFSFTEKKDSLGNLWKGLKICTTVTKNKKHRGLAFSQYYLLLSGVPVLCMYCEFQKEGEYTQDRMFEYQCFFKGSEKPEDLNVRWTTNDYAKMDALGASVLLGSEAKNDLALYDKNKKMHIHPFTGSGDKKGHYMDMHLLMLWFNNYASAEADKLSCTSPNFLIFTEENITNDMLSDLGGIHFE